MDGVTTIQLMLWGTVAVGFVAGCLAWWNDKKGVGLTLWAMGWVSFVNVVTASAICT